MLRITRTVRNRRAGYTLIETLLAATIMSMALGAVAAIFVIGLRLFSVSTRHDIAVSRAATAAETIASLTRDALVITDAQDHSVTFSLPERDTDGFYIINDTVRETPYHTYMTPDTPITVTLENDGRITRTQGGITRNLTANISDLTFTYDGQPASAVTNPEVVTRLGVSVTAVGHPNEPQPIRTFTREVALRNRW